MHLYISGPATAQERLPNQKQMVIVFLESYVNSRTGQDSGPNIYNSTFDRFSDTYDIYFLVYVSQVYSWFGLGLGRLNLSIAFGMSCASRSVSHKAHKTLQLPINSFGFQKIPRCADAPFWKKSSSPFHVFLKTHMIQTDTVSIATAIIQHGWLWKSRCSTTRASPARKSTGTTNSMTEWGLSSWIFFCMPSWWRLKGKNPMWPLVGIFFLRRLANPDPRFC